VILVALLAQVGCGEPAEPVDLVLRNGTVVTVDESRPQAEAVAVANGRIVAVGSDREIDRYVGPSTDVIDLDGRVAVPGFIEGHGHFMSLGNAKIILDLTQVKNFGEIVAMVSHVASDAAPGAWISGRGWHQEKWDELPDDAVEGVPTHAALSAVSPDNPVILTHASGHGSFANAKALERAGIDRHTADPFGGEIVHDAQGEPTGLLREKAQLLAREAQARDEAGREMAEVDAERVRMVQLAGEDLLSKGITGFHDAGASFETIDFFKRMAEAGDLPVRLYVMVRFETNEAMEARLADYKMVNEYDGFLTVRSIKRQIDGALGSHGAWLLEPYVDLPQSSGLALESVEEVTRTAEIAIANGFQVNTHAIGDRANREVLDIYEDVFRANGNPQDLRWRIEHAQHVHPDDVPRFASLGVIAAMQGVHATSDGPWVASRLGEERVNNGAYVWRDFMRADVVVANGTDVPVEDADPIASFYSSVSRRLNDGSVFMSEQRMTREEALRSYTINNAYAAFEEDVKGSLTPGKYADIVVLSKNIMTVPEDEIPDAKVDLTILGGQVVYRKE
jgi:predicted amidohydrolase YtcJ